MNIEKIEINGHYVLVDKDAEIKENNWYIGFEVNYSTEPKERWVIYNCGVGANGNPHYKIIAASPELNLEGVPTYVEYLAEQKINRNEWNSLESSFIKGYQTAEKELPTWDDVRKAIYMVREIKYVTYSEDEIIETIKQSKK